MSSAERSGLPLTMVMCDLDNFKDINDHHGHDVGDQVLVWFAEIASSIMRTNDILARLGGDEFVFLLPDTNEDDAFHLLQRLRMKMAEEPLESLDHITTASFGAVEWSMGENLKSLLKRADQTLYHGKEHGKDQVITANGNSDKKAG